MGGGKGGSGRTQAPPTPAPIPGRFSRRETYDNGIVIRGTDVGTPQDDYVVAERAAGFARPGFLPRRVGDSRAEAMRLAAARQAPAKEKTTKAQTTSRNRDRDKGRDDDNRQRDVAHTARSRNRGGGSGR